MMMEKEILMAILNRVHQHSFKEGEVEEEAEEEVGEEVGEEVEEAEVQLKLII